MHVLVFVIWTSCIGSSISLPIRTVFTYVYTIHWTCYTQPLQWYLSRGHEMITFCLHTWYRWRRWRRWWSGAIIYGSLLLVAATVWKCSLAAVDCRQNVLHGVLQICGPVMWGDLVHCPSTLWVSAKSSSSVAAVVTCCGTRPAWLEWNAMVTIS